MISIVCVLHEPITVQGRQGPLIGKDDRNAVACQEIAQKRNNLGIENFATLSL